MRINSSKVINFIQKSESTLGSPEQRLIIGVTALATQPVIDLNNKKTDKETRVLTACKSVAKIIAGTTSGFVVRAGMIKLVERFGNESGILAPSLEGSLKSIENYQKTLGTLLATFVMLGTNFIWDAPVTKKLTNYLYDKVSKKGANDGTKPT